MKCTICECEGFSPHIFKKGKCKCFHTPEEHGETQAVNPPPSVTKPLPLKAPSPSSPSSSSSSSSAEPSPAVRAAPSPVVSPRPVSNITPTTITSTSAGGFVAKKMILQPASIPVSMQTPSSSANLNNNNSGTSIQYPGPTAVQRVSLAATKKSSIFSSKSSTGGSKRVSFMSSSSSSSSSSAAGTAAAGGHRMSSVDPSKRQSMITDMGSTNPQLIDLPTFINGPPDPAKDTVTMLSVVAWLARQGTINMRQRKEVKDQILGGDIPQAKEMLAKALSIEYAPISTSSAFQDESRPTSTSTAGGKISARQQRKMQIREMGGSKKLTSSTANDFMTEAVNGINQDDDDEEGVEEKASREREEREKEKESKRSRGISLGWNPEELVSELFNEGSSTLPRPSSRSFDSDEKESDHCVQPTPDVSPLTRTAQPSTVSQVSEDVEAPFSLRMSRQELARAKNGAGKRSNAGSIPGHRHTQTLTLQNSPFVESDDEDLEDEEGAGIKLNDEEKKAMLDKLEVILAEISTYKYPSVRRGLPHGVSAHFRHIASELQLAIRIIHDFDCLNEDKPVLESLLELHEHAYQRVMDKNANHQIERFRQLLSQYPLERTQYLEWNAPQYFSAMPLPSKCTIGLTCSVFLDVAVLTNTSDPHYARMVFAISESVTAEKLAEDALKKVGKAGVVLKATDSGSFCLKAKGYNDWFIGPHPLLDYDYVRTSARKGTKMEFVLTIKPELTENKVPEEVRTYQATALKNASGTERIDAVNLGGSDVDFSEAEFMDEVDSSFSLSVLTIRDMSSMSVPLFTRLVEELFVMTFVFHGTKVVAGTVRQTSSKPCENSGVSGVKWMENLEPDPQASSNPPAWKNLPPGARVAFLLYGRKKEFIRLLAYGIHPLVDERGLLVQGSVKMRLWGLMQKQDKTQIPFPLDGDWTFLARASTSQNYECEIPAILEVKFPSFFHPVVATTGQERMLATLDAVRGGTPSLTSPLLLHLQTRGDIMNADNEPYATGKAVSFPKSMRESRDHILSRDALHVMTPDERSTIWEMRKTLTVYPLALPFLLQACDFTLPANRLDMYRMLPYWSPLKPAQAIALLDVKYGDSVCRSFAVSCLRSISDYDLQPYILQLVQCIKFESLNFSSLVCFLLDRAVQSPNIIGHQLFWGIKAEMMISGFYERYALFLEAYLTYTPRAATSLGLQHQCCRQLERVAEDVRLWKNGQHLPDEIVNAQYQKQLQELNKRFFRNLPGGKVTLPLNPRWEVSTLVEAKCKFMSSAKKPLWLVFRNADSEGENKMIIFKSGDDLRQDMLTLQLLKAMDRMWLAGDMDMRLSPYQCIATGTNSDGEGVGMIEVVRNSDTTSGIQMKYGGGALGALKNTPLDNFIRFHNTTEVKYKEAVDNFIRSCAGYCVASYVLGIGDRHNGNIMMKEDGHLFHIDFGHFLGNFKQAMGFNRERSAFVFTPEMAYVFGGKNYKKSVAFRQFQDLCTTAFNLLRAEGVLMENLFILMVSAGMPELLKESDIGYLSDMLQLDLSNEEVAKVFEKEILKSVTTTYRRLDNALHIAKHKN